MVRAVTRKGRFMTDPDDVLAALERLLAANETATVAMERAITDRMGAIEGDRGDEFITRLKADLNSLIDTVNAMRIELDVQTITIATLGRYVLERDEG